MCIRDSYNGLLRLWTSDFALTKFWKSRNTECIGGFSKRIVREKDLSESPQFIEVPDYLPPPDFILTAICLHLSSILTLFTQFFHLNKGENPIERSQVLS